MLNLKGITTDAIISQWEDCEWDKVVAIDARGFIFGSVLAHHFGKPLSLARKKGKLPGDTISTTYQLEYGEDILEMDKISINAQDRCLLVDDLIATGGTAKAACELIEELGGTVAGCAFIIELPELNGREFLGNYDVRSLVSFEGH